MKSPHKKENVFFLGSGPALLLTHRNLRWLGTFLFHLFFFFRRGPFLIISPPLPFPLWMVAHWPYRWKRFLLFSLGRGSFSIYGRFVACRSGYCWLWLVGTSIKDHSGQQLQTLLQLRALQKTGIRLSDHFPRTAPTLIYIPIECVGNLQI